MGGKGGRREGAEGRERGREGESVIERSCAGLRSQGCRVHGWCGELERTVPIFNQLVVKFSIFVCRGRPSTRRRTPWSRWYVRAGVWVCARPRACLCMHACVYTCVRTYVRADDGAH